MDLSSVQNFELPDAPSGSDEAVKAWFQPVSLPTYDPQAPDKNPMFLEKRVYQGSSGRVYPIPFIDRIAVEPRVREWQAVHIENEYLRLMILPEIGGRIHVGLDKINQYDFFYRQNVIKPALVGLAGPWISGGVEFNWPQHHRPATFMPVEVTLEAHEDGSKTIWCSDHDPLNRMKGMHGVCLHPGKAYLEVKVRLYNRTPFVQTFLWWANVATQVHEQYQSFFPPDVHVVADHAKRAMSQFQLCQGVYYGIDYAARARWGVSAEESPRHFVPPGTYAPNDLSWYANIPVPTSYMVVNSREDFFGGYDHARKAGVVHVANHHIAPGKKQWTWGNHEFGYAWDKNLTDNDGPYIELMAGVYTDNQPDFSFLAPGETKTFSQCWYPIREIGPPQAANLRAAINFQVSSNLVRVGVVVTQDFLQASIRVEGASGVIWQWNRDLVPGVAFLEEFELGPESRPEELSVAVRTSEGREILRARSNVSKEPLAAEQPQPATEPPEPAEVPTSEELYLTGLHLAQYRHATRLPESYWREALRRDPGDSRSNNALGIWYLRRGEFAEAEQCLRQAIGRLTHLNPNPYDAEPHYHLGLALQYQCRYEEAYAAFYKATWNWAWRAAAHYALGELDSRREGWAEAEKHLRFALRANADHSNARNLLAVVLRRLGCDAEAEALIAESLAIDPADQWARYISDSKLPADNQLTLDLVFDYARAGFYVEACDLLESANLEAKDGTVPLIYYALAHYCRALGSSERAERMRDKAETMPPDYCFPNRLEEMIILESAVASDPTRARANYYLGNFFYDRKRYDDAIRVWEASVRQNPNFATVWRNLGIAYFNVLHDPREARVAFDRAYEADPQDARVLYERDQLMKRIGISPRERLAELERHLDLVSLRDDLSVEVATLSNQTAQHSKALAVLNSRTFQPWEGGEGLTLAQHIRAHVALGRIALADGDAETAKSRFEAALENPPNLGEARHLLSNESNIHYWLGMACWALGDETPAQHWWTRAAKKSGDFQEMSVREFSEMSYYNALALERLGKPVEAEQLLRRLLQYSSELTEIDPKIDYFATSLPAMLLFTEDLQRKNLIAAQFLGAQARIGLGDEAEGEALLDQLLSIDPNHSLAADLLEELHCNKVLKESLFARR